jgi:phage terminase large subunit GpA-like protein
MVQRIRIQRRRLRKEEPIPLSRWIERVVRLPVGLSAEPGPIKLAPYMVEIADAIGDPAVERITCIKSARIGWTTIMSAAVAHFLIRDPCRVLTLWPTESDARGWVVSDLEPIFEDSPALCDHLPMPHPGRSDRTTLLHRIGNNGAALTVVGAGAPRNLRRHTARVLMIDEADACEVLSEGDPISLAVQRTLSFANRKILVGSTPLDAATSHVCRLYAQSDQRVYEVPCPECGSFAEIRWADIEWPENRPEDAAWRCPHCRELVAEQHKASMVCGGHWRALRPDAPPSHRGYRINALVSSLPNATWPKLAAEFERARDRDDTLRVFRNTVLAEPWDEAADAIDDADLASRVEDFSVDRIPPEVLAVTVGADVQGDRIEATFIGHAADGTTFVLGHEVIYGSPQDDDLWAEVDALLRRRFKHPAGGELKVDAAVIDSGGKAGVFDRVVAFCNARISKRVFAGQGAAGFARAAFTLTRTKKGSRRLAVIGVDVLKTSLFNRLRGPSIRFSRSLSTDWFEQLCSEVRVVRVIGGRPRPRFERKPGMRAEALDCVVYTLAARAALSLSAAVFSQRMDELTMPVPPKPPPAVIRSTWMDR